MSSQKSAVKKANSSDDDKSGSDLHPNSVVPSSSSSTQSQSQPRPPSSHANRVRISSMRNSYEENGDKLSSVPVSVDSPETSSVARGHVAAHRSFSDSIDDSIGYGAIGNVQPLRDQKALRNGYENQQAAALLNCLNAIMQAGGGLDSSALMKQSNTFMQHQSTVVQNHVMQPQSVSLSVSANDNDSAKPVKRLVNVGVIFLKINDIDTVREQYSAEICVQARWREPLLDGKTPDELKLCDISKLWSPSLYVENLIVETKESLWLGASQDEQGVAYILERRRIRGVFLENLELQSFPFDVQDLSIMVVSEQPMAKVELMPDQEDPSSVNVSTFADEQEWNLYEHVEVNKKTIKTEFANQQRQHSAIQVTCRAARRPGYFYYNVFLVMFFISSIAFGTFSVDCSLPQNRLQLSFTLLLTSITFKMVINQSLPKISYLTCMDKYVLMSLVFLVLICVWHSVVPTLCVDQSPGSFYSNKMENFVMLAFFLVYVIGHILFAAYVYVQAWKRRLQMQQMDTEFQQLRRIATQ